MRKGILLTGVILPLFAALPVFAQLAAPNESGISLGHLHLLSKNPEAQKKIWVEAFGAQLTKTGTLELLRLPGIFIIINNAEPSGGSVGSTVDHIALSVKNTAAMKAKLEGMNVPVIGSFATFPDNLRVVLLVEKNQTLPLVMHHVHLTTPGMEVVKQWYVKTFGAVAGTRRDLPAAVFNGSALDFLPAQMPAAPTKAARWITSDLKLKTSKHFARSS